MNEPTTLQELAKAVIADPPNDLCWMARMKPQEILDVLDRLEAAEKMLGRNRWNIDIDGEDLIICRGEHEKCDGCEEDRYVPFWKLKEVEAKLKAAGELQRYKLEDRYTGSPWMEPDKHGTYVSFNGLQAILKE